MAGATRQQRAYQQAASFLSLVAVYSRPSRVVPVLRRKLDLFWYGLA